MTRRRIRVIERPMVGPGPLKDLKDLLYRLYLEAGPPTLDQIVYEVRILADELGRQLPGGEDEVDALIGAVPGRDAVAAVIGGRDVPAGQQDVVAVAVALARAGGRLHGSAAAAPRVFYPLLSCWERQARRHSWLSVHSRQAESGRSARSGC